MKTIKDLKKKSIWIIGSGSISKEYFKVLRKKNFIIVVGRGKKTSDSFEKETGHKVISGGLNNFLATSPTLPKYVIIAVDILLLTEISKTLIKYGVKKILCEKPGAIFLKDLKYIDRLSKKNLCKFYIAYNRRFYENINQAKSNDS